MLHQQKQQAKQLHIDSLLQVTWWKPTNNWTCSIARASSNEPRRASENQNELIEKLTKKSQLAWRAYNIFGR